MAYSFNPSIVTNGLVLCYDFSSVKSYPGTGTSVTDISRNSNTGTLQNGPTFATNLCSLDGTNDYISTTLSLPSPTTTPTTFEIVFKNNSNASFKGLIGWSAWQSNGFSVGFNSLAALKYTCSGAGVGSDDNVTYDSSVLSHATCVFNGRSISTYRNGIFVSTITLTFDPIAAGSPIYIGTIGQGGWTTAQVDISVVRVYNRALSSFEVLQNYNATKGRYGL